MAGFHSILSAIRSLDSSSEVVSISYDSRSPHGNINNKSIPEGNKFTKLLGCFSRQFTLRLVGSPHTMEESLKIHIKEEKTIQHQPPLQECYCHILNGRWERQVMYAREKSRYVVYKCKSCLQCCLHTK